jgi:hypothetical protein
MGSKVAPAASSKSRALAQRAWRGTKRLMLFSALGLVAVAALYLLAAYSFTYSTGERAGYVQKFSKKGWLCKTWEGELAMANLPGAMPEKFEFTLHDDAVAAQINNSMGQRVTLTYEQKVGLPSCFGDTPYWVTQVRAIEPAK